MSVPIRRPDFESIYPTANEFKQAIEEFRAMAAQTPVTPEPSSVADVQAIASSALRHGPLCRGASSRLASSEVLSQGGGHIVSEHEGQIETLLFSVPKFSDTANPSTRVDPHHLGHYRSIVTTLGPDVRYVFVARPDQEFELRRMLSDVDAAKVTLVSSPRFNLSIWVQDAHVALNDSGGTPILCEGVAFNRFDDMTVADDLAAERIVAALQSFLYFQGGNVLGGKNLTLIGRDYVWKNTKRFGLPGEPAVLQAFEKQFGTPMLALGGEINSDPYDFFARGITSGFGLQPIFHIDMYVTRTGVKDPSSDKEIVFVGRPAAARTVTGSYSDMPELDNPTYDAFFEPTVRQLSEHFEVRSLPLWITFGNLRDEDKRQKFYNLTWNNALVESGDGIRRVLLPNYADAHDARIYGVDVRLREDLQSAVEEAWRALEFDVQFTDSMEDLAWGDGAVHCMTKTLLRT